MYLVPPLAPKESPESQASPGRAFANFGTALGFATEPTAERVAARPTPAATPRSGPTSSQLPAMPCTPAATKFPGTSPIAPANWNPFPVFVDVSQLDFVGMFRVGGAKSFLFAEVTLL